MWLDQTQRHVIFRTNGQQCASLLRMTAILIIDKLFIVTNILPIIIIIFIFLISVIIVAEIHNIESEDIKKFDIQFVYVHFIIYEM